MKAKTRLRVIEKIIEKKTERAERLIGVDGWPLLYADRSKEFDGYNYRLFYFVSDVSLCSDASVGMKAKSVVINGKTGHYAVKQVTFFAGNPDRPYYKTRFDRHDKKVADNRLKDLLKEVGAK